MLLQRYTVHVRTNCLMSEHYRRYIIQYNIKCTYHNKVLLLLIANSTKSFNTPPPYTDNYYDHAFNVIILVSPMWSHCVLVNSFLTQFCLLNIIILIVHDILPTSFGELLIVIYLIIKLLI